jgi:hypothetical protein
VPIRSMPTAQASDRSSSWVIVWVRWGVPDGGEHVVDDRGGEVVGECPVGDETPVEGGAGEEVDGELKVGGGGDVAAPAGLGEDVPEGFAAAFGELGVQARQGGIAFGGVDEGGHQPGEGLTADQGLEPGDQFDQVGPQLSGRGQGQWLEGHVHGVDQQGGPGRPVPVERGLAGAGAAGDGFHRESGQALVGEYLKRRPQHPLPGAVPPWDRGTRRSCSWRVLLGGLLAAVPGGCRITHRNGTVPLVIETVTYR